eukprot:16431301-Heterocapsa_arctica.AAC.1
MSKVERNTLSKFGGGPLVSQGRHQIHAFAGVHTVLPHCHDHLLKWGQSGLPGRSPVRGHGQQAICHGIGI